MNKKIILVIVVILVILGIYYFESMRVNVGSGGGVSVPTDVEVDDKEGRYPVAPELVGISGYLNVDDIRISELHEYLIYQFTGENIKTCNIIHRRENGKIKVKVEDL